MNEISIARKSLYSSSNWNKTWKLFSNNSVPDWRNRNGGGLLVYIDIHCKELKSHSLVEDIEDVIIEI